MKKYSEKKNDFDNPVWHIHRGNPPKYESEINFNSLLNLVSVCNTTEKKIIWGFVQEYDKSLKPETDLKIDELIQFAINYYVDFILPKKKYLKIPKENLKVFEDLLFYLKSIKNDITSEEIQTNIYSIGKKHNFSNLRDYFKLIYQVLLGQEQGPRLGSFIRLYGITKTIELLDKTIQKSK